MASGMVPAETASASDLGSFNVNMQVTMDPEPNYDNQSPTITVTYRARVWTTGGNGKTVTGYNTNDYPYLGQSWPFSGVSVAATGDVAKEVKAEITVTFSADAQGKLVITGGEDWVDGEEEKLVENLDPSALRVRKVVSHVKIRRNGLKIEARGWVAHMFDGYVLNPTTGKVTEGIQNDVKNGNVLNHTVIHIPGGANPASFPFSRLYEVRGPFPY